MTLFPSRKIQKTIRKEVIQKVISSKYFNNKTIYHIQPSGAFIIGGSMSDSGLTGRKILFDIYGGCGANGGGFSRKDYIKVDLFGAYDDRWIVRELHHTSRSLSMRGLLIAFEGLDKTGKSTQASRLCAYIKNSLSQSCKAMRFPDRSTTIGCLVSSYLKDENHAELEDHVIHLLFSANRWEARNSILSAIEGGTHVIMDRYAYSGVVYTAAKGYSMDWCMKPDEGLPKPDIIFYLDASKISVGSRPDYGREIYETKEFQEKVRGKYQELATAVISLGHNWINIDASQSIDSIHKKIREIIDEILQNPLRKLDIIW